MLVKEISLPPRVYFDLAAEVSNYLARCMRAFGVSDPMELPSRTPNGVVMPKREVLTPFNLVEACAADALRAVTQTPPRYVQWPVNVRVRDSAREAGGERPYSTRKAHTDVWTGEPANSKTVIIPLLGNAAAGVDFGEARPGTFDPEDFGKEYASYEEGQKAVPHIDWYGLVTKPMHAYVMDGNCIHKSSPFSGLRVSLDFRFCDEEPLPASRAGAYLPLEEWLNKRTRDVESVSEAIAKYRPERAA